MTSHAILGVSSKASKEEIKRAYHKLCLIHHPDKGGNAETFIRIKSAYEQLINSHKPYVVYNDASSPAVYKVSELYNTIGGSIEHTFIINNIIGIRIYHNGEIIQNWYTDGKSYITLTVSRSTLLKTKFMYNLCFITKTGDESVVSYVWRDPRSRLRKLIDYLF